MKKVILLAGLFLIGISAQANTTYQENVASTPGKNKRYTNAQEISFVENGILFFISTSGYFDYNVLNQSHQNYNRTGSDNYPVSYQRVRRGENNYRKFIQRDRYGNIVQVNRTPISYNKNGKVKSIGAVKFKYHKGQLVRIGGLEITYNRFGDIRDTFGYINPYNNVCHDGCNLQNEDHWDHHRNNDKGKNKKNKGYKDKKYNRRS